MKRAAYSLTVLLLAGRAAFAGSASGNDALAFASMVAEQSPLLNLNEKSVMNQLLRPEPNLSYVSDKKIRVEADSVVCRESNVDIISRSCELTFGATKVIVRGRKAHELFATIAEFGVEPDGAAGTIYESVSHVACAIDPAEVKQKDGGGASCNFEPGRQ
jgi:hypothetical protein